MINLENLLNELNDPQKEEKEVKIKKDNKKIKIQEEILEQLQGHINYFRLIYKIYKKVKESLKTNASGIKSFKLQLLYYFE